MKIKFVQISNFRKLQSAHIDFDDKTTIFVGANNSGKTSAMLALRYFLVNPNQLALRDITIANWTKIDALGSKWEMEATDDPENLDGLLPYIDIWLDVALSEIHYVAHILPTLDWKGGLLGVRLKYGIKDLDKLKADFLLHRKAAEDTSANAPDNVENKIRVWPVCLTEFLEKRLQTYIELKAFSLNPLALEGMNKGNEEESKGNEEESKGNEEESKGNEEESEKSKLLLDSAFPLEKDPFKHLIKIHDIAAQRDFVDAGGRSSTGENASEAGGHRYKRRLSDQLRIYYDRHLDPTKMPSAEDYKALSAIQTAEQHFDTRLEEGFFEAFKELEDLGYPGMNNPKLKISTQLRATDGLKHGSAVQYQVADPSGDGSNALHLPEDYSGLGYQNLIAMVFMLMGFRDEWMREGKASATLNQETQGQIQPLHLVLVEEPEAHLHAQVQQVFIKKAYELLRKHKELGDNTCFSTQLIVSTHSSHIAHEAEFASLRYFRRRTALSSGETATTTVANLSTVFGPEDKTQQFVKRYLKATHCDLFFADGIIFVEGQAERILVPHFIRQHFKPLSRRYITLLELGGSHIHRFKSLIDELGLTTLIIADLDSVQEEKKKDKNGKDTTVWKATKPQSGVGQKTSNSILKEWHPKKELVDELITITPEEHVLSNNEGYDLYVAYQKKISILQEDASITEVIPRTFEDAFILENTEIFAGIEDSKTINKINAIVEEKLSGGELADELFQLVNAITKAEFALECLMLDSDEALKPPSYIKDGLSWLEDTLGNGIEGKQAEIKPHDGK